MSKAQTNTTSTGPRMVKGGGVHLVVVPIDYSENIRVLIDELRSHAQAKSA